MEMFTIYLDESYGPDDAYSVAGYVAKAGQWMEFEREWREMLKEEGISELHKTDLENLAGEYKKWRSLPKAEQEKIKDRINYRASGIILRRANAGFSTSVKRSDWDSIHKGRWGHIIGNSYYAAGVKACMALVSKWADRFYPNEWIDYVLESGNPDADEVNKIILQIHKTPDWKEAFRLNTWSFASKKNTVGRSRCNLAVIPLQAADYIAYETYKEMGGRIVEGVKRDKRGNEILRRKELMRILQHDLQARGEYRGLKNDQMPTPHWMLYYMKADVENMILALNEHFPDQPM